MMATDKLVVVVCRGVDDDNPDSEVMGVFQKKISSCYTATNSSPFTSPPPLSEAVVRPAHLRHSHHHPSPSPSCKPPRL